MCIDLLLVAAHAQLIGSLIGWLVGCPPRKCTFHEFEIRNKMVKATAADDNSPGVNTIKSPQSNPDLSNGQLKIHLLRRENDFGANIFGALLRHLYFLGSRPQLRILSEAYFSFDYHATINLLGFWMLPFNESCTHFLKMKRMKTQLKVILVETFLQLNRQPADASQI